MSCSSTMADVRAREARERQAALEEMDSHLLRRRA
jgi:hypothetical protein